jgi:hypothetical protein
MLGIYTWYMAKSLVKKMMPGTYQVSTYQLEQIIHRVCTRNI